MKKIPKVKDVDKCQQRKITNSTFCFCLYVQPFSTRRDGRNLWLMQDFTMVGDLPSIPHSIYLPNSQGRRQLFRATGSKVSGFRHDGVRCGEGDTLSPPQVASGEWEGASVPLPRKSLDFCFQNGAFWRARSERLY